MGFHEQNWRGHEKWGDEPNWDAQWKSEHDIGIDFCCVPIGCQNGDTNNLMV